MAAGDAALTRAYGHFVRMHLAHDPAQSQLPPTSAFYRLAGDTPPADRAVAAALCSDAAAFRAPLELDTMRTLVPPRAGCGLCGGTGARRAIPPAGCLCECVGGCFGVSWLRDPVT